MKRKIKIYGKNLIGFIPALFEFYNVKRIILKYQLRKNRQPINCYGSYMPYRRQRVKAKLKTQLWSKLSELPEINDDE